ncbi:MAG: PKD domain-containing protein [Thermoplasmata archaeon]|nr:PKD domain-containing protein [Thermoplasmata archaeon]
MAAWRLTVSVALVVALAFLGTIPSVTALPSASSSAPLSSVAAGTSATPVVPGTAPPPPLKCPLGYPGYGQLPGNVWPLDPNPNLQGPCPLIAVDEIHASFASGSNGSAEHWSIPWTLPAQGSAGQQYVEEGLYVGMVVSGDPNSTYNQSYLEVLATPSTNALNELVWGLNLTVLSFVNSSHFKHGLCADTAENLSWNQSYYCEINDLAQNQTIPLYSGLAAGQSLAVSFNGTKGAPGGMQVSLNGTGLTPTNVTLNASTTGTYGFQPAYTAACAVNCFLDWGLSYGLGVGIDVCPWFTAVFSQCDSYNGTAYPTLPPAAWGIPEYWNTTTQNYTGDYRYFQPESASGVCDTNPPGGVPLAGCQEFTTGGGDGFYPYFSLTAAGLDFGTTYPGSATTWGEAYGQYLDTSGVQDLVPLVVTHVVDSSLAGFLAPSDPLNVTFNVTDLGSIATATLAWDLGGSAWTTDVLSGVGTASGSAYLGTIPSGANGLLRYQVNATNAAGLAYSTPVRSVLRGPLPLFSITVLIAPAGCGTVQVASVPYSNGSVLQLGPGPVSISESGCYPYRFTGWLTTPALAVSPSGGAAATLTVGGNGTLTANFLYVRPVEALAITVRPDGCGNVVLDGTPYANDSVAELLFGISYNLVPSVLCAGYAFGGWDPGPNVTVLGSSLLLSNNGTLAVSFVPISVTSNVTFATTPATCGGIGLGGAGYSTGQSVYVYPGTYTLTPEPCRHFGFDNFTTVGSGLSVSGTSLTVTGAGTVTEHDFALTEIYVETNPGYCGGIDLDGTDYTNGSYVPVGNHSSDTVTAYTCAGHYLDGFSAEGGLVLEGSLLTVNGSGTLLVVSLPGSPSIFVGFVTEPGKCGAIDLGGVAYTNGAFISLAPGTNALVSAVPCTNYGNVAWSLTGNIAIVNGVAYLNGSGAITAVFGALVPILIETEPANCGAVLLDGASWASGTTPTLINGRVYSIVAAPCAHYELEAFESSPYVAIENNTIAPDGPSTITAVFVPTPYFITTNVLGNGCGTVALGGAPVGQGEVFNLTAGNYTLTELPCGTSDFAGFNLSGNLSFAAGHLFVNGSGNLTATFLPILPSVSLGGSTDDFVGGTALFYAAVQVPVATSGYTYDWNFGDGATNTTTGNTSTHVFERTGTFTVTVEVIDPYHHIANATLTVTVVAQSGTSYAGSLTTALVVLGVAAVALVAIVLVGRRRPPAAAPEGAPAPPTPELAGPPEAPAAPPY